MKKEVNKAAKHATEHKPTMEAGLLMRQNIIPTSATIIADTATNRAGTTKKNIMKNDMSSLPCGASAIHSAAGMHTSGTNAHINGAPINQMRVEDVMALMWANVQSSGTRDQMT
jgi:hypothetical protein